WTISTPGSNGRWTITWVDRERSAFSDRSNFFQDPLGVSPLQKQAGSRYPLQVRTPFGRLRAFRCYRSRNIPSGPIDPTWPPVASIEISHDALHDRSTALHLQPLRSKGAKPDRRSEE